MPRRRNQYAHRNPPSARERRRAAVTSTRQKQRVADSLAVIAARLVRKGLTARLDEQEEDAAAEA